MEKDDIAGPRRGGRQQTADARKGGGRYPACDAPTQHRFRPFCSKRCQDADLGRWLRGAYRVPTEEAPVARDPGAAPEDDDEPGLGGD